MAEPSVPEPRGEGSRRRFNPELRFEERVKPLELFFDLVFVLAFTQCTALMSAMPTWEGMAQAMLVLGVLWWAWVGYAWLTSVVDPEEGGVRIAMFAAMAGLVIAGLCAPEAFGDRALPFAVAYGLVRAGQIVLFLIAARDDAALHRSIVGLAVSSAVGVGLLVSAAFVDGPAQWTLWILAVVIDFGGPAVFGSEGWTLVPVHFAERHSLVIILALGESVVALGVGTEVALEADVYVAVFLGVALAAALWWIYFDVVALVNARRLELAPAGRTRNNLARDSYSYLHFPMVAGIVLSAFGVEEALLHLDHHLELVAAFALFGGVAVYLLAHVALRLRNARTVSRTRFGVAVVMLALWPVALHASALLSLVAVNAVLWPMIAYENAHYDERRYRLRHGLDVDPPRG
jgi:low temperature requirement protein LtrA